MAKVSKMVDLFFSGQGDMIMFPLGADFDYATATLADFGKGVWNRNIRMTVDPADEAITDPSDITELTPFGAAVSLGSILEDSTTWAGEEPSTEGINNEQGIQVITTSSAGSYGFTCTAMNISPDSLGLLLGADYKKIADISAGTGAGQMGDDNWLERAYDIIGFGKELPVMECPIAIVNETNNMSLIFAKAKIIATPTIESGVLCLALNVMAQLVDTTNLSTVMIARGKVQKEA